MNISVPAENFTGSEPFAIRNAMVCGLAGELALLRSVCIAAE